MTLLASVALLLGIGVASASAAPTAQPGYGFRAAFQTNFSYYQFSPPRDQVAIDGHGNIFIPNENVGLVYIFAPDSVAGGVPLATVATDNGILPRDLAVDPGDDALYIQETDFFGPDVRRYLSDGNPTPKYTLDAGFAVPRGESIVVDPSTHDLLVANVGAEGIRRYSQAGVLLATIATPSMIPTQITAAPDGSVWAAQGSTVLHLSPTGTVLDEVTNAGAIQDIAVDPITGRLVVDADGSLKLYSPSGVLLSTSVSAGNGGVSVSVGGDGLLYEFTGGAVNAYVPATQPGVEAPVVSSIGHHSAHLSAEVDPGAGPPAGSAAHFEYSDDGGKTWTSTPDQALAGPTTVEADITGLTINFAFLVRVKASNSLTSHISAATPFSTPETAPETETAAATDVSETSAVLNGTVNPAGLQSTYHFEYGLTGAYGSRVPVGIDAVAGDGRENRIFSRTIAGLTPGTTYHFRLIAQNSLGVTQGADRTFTTAAVGGIPHRAYEQVTPVDKHGIPIWELGIQAKASGSAIVYAAQGGSESSPSYAMSMGLRGGADWAEGIDLDPPLNPPGGNIISQTTLAVSPDFTHVLVATNRKLSPDAVEDGPVRLNLYVTDVATGAHTLIATAPSGLFNFIANGSGADFLAGAPDFSWVVFRSTPSLLPGAPEGALYRWSVAQGLEVVSVLPDGEPEPVALGSTFDPIVHSVSADGSSVYFIALSAGLEGLYRWEEGHQSKAISVSHISGDPATPLPARLIGASKDGRYAFFLSREGKLTSDAPGSVPEVQGDVYRYDASDDSLEYLDAAAFDNGQFLAPVGVTDDGQTAYFRGPFSSNSTFVWRDGVVKTAAPFGVSNDDGIQAFMSPNGRYLVYAEAGSVFLYDAETDQRGCVSCLPDGSRADGRLPVAIKFVSNRLPQAVTDAGQVFFTSFARLVAADVNGSRDVYEYKDGKNTLISPGNAPFDALFSDISEDGSDVFFTTNQKLVGQDNDESVDVYDARVDGGLAKQNPPPPQECVRDDCKATPNAGLELPFGGSEALSGPGNVSAPARKRCAKGAHARKVKGKTRCVKQSKAKSTKRANTNRRQGR